MKILDNFALPFFAQFGSQPFREKKLWFEENDYILKQHKLIVDNIYHKYSGAKTLPGKRKFMSLEELKHQIKDAGVEKEITDRDTGLVFNLSMMTQIDEIYSFRVFEMSYTEYLEVIGRLADKVSLPSMYYTDEEVSFFVVKKIRSLMSQGKREMPSHYV